MTTISHASGLQVDIARWPGCQMPRTELTAALTFLAHKAGKSVRCAPFRDGGLSARSCTHYVRAIKQFSRWLWRDGRAPEYTLAHISGYNDAVDRRHDRRALTDAELAKLIAAAETGPELYGISGPDRAMLYRLAVGTGFRRNELRNLTPECFDLDSAPPTITVEAAYSKHRRRDVQPIRRDLADLVRPWLATRRKGRPVIDTSEWNWHRTAKMMRYDLKTAEVAFCDARGLYADFHSLRHTYITNIGRSGASMKTHQELARHSPSAKLRAVSLSNGEPGLTMRCTHTQLEDKVRALETLPPANPAAANGTRSAVA